MLVFFPMINCGGRELVVVNISLLVFSRIFGLIDSRHVHGEDNSTWVAEDGSVGHFEVDCCSAVGSISWFNPENLFSIKA